MNVCADKSGCIAVVEKPGMVCAIHRNICADCGHHRDMHPVVQFTEEFGPITKCYDFKEAGEAAS